VTPGQPIYGPPDNTAQPGPPAEASTGHRTFTSCSSNRRCSRQRRTAHAGCGPASSTGPLGLCTPQGPRVPPWPWGTGSDLDHPEGDQHATRTGSADALLAAFNGDGTAALLYIARRFEIAVAWIDRDIFAQHLGRDLTDDEWDQIVPSLGQYDKRVSECGDNPQSEFVNGGSRKPESAPTTSRMTAKPPETPGSVGPACRR